MLQDVLCSYHISKAECLPLFDFQPCAQAAGLEEVFETLSAVDFSESQASFYRQKSLSVEQVRELASKTWSDRQGGAVEIMDPSRFSDAIPKRTDSEELLAACSCRRGKDPNLAEDSGAMGRGRR